MRLLLISILSLLSTLSFAQLQKGNYLLGGSLKVYSSKDGLPASTITSKWFTLEVNPRLGYFISDNVAIGIDPGYAFRTVEVPEPGGYQQKRSTYSFMPFIRNYMPVGDKVAFFFHSALGPSYVKEKNKQSSINPDGTINTTEYNYDLTNGQVSVNAGATYFITSKWSVEATFASLSYQFLLKKDKKTDENSHELLFNYGASAFHFGVTYFVNR